MNDREADELMDQIDQLKQACRRWKTIALSVMGAGLAVVLLLVGGVGWLATRAVVMERQARMEAEQARMMEIQAREAADRARMEAIQAERAAREAQQRDRQNQEP